MFLALGVMSGTSADGVDFGLIQTNGIKKVKLLKHDFVPYPSSLKNKIIRAYNQPLNPCNQKLENEITNFQTAAIKKFLRINASIKPNFIGVHGQTIFHQPPLYDQGGFCIQKGKTRQLGFGNKISQDLDIPVVWDFRSEDMRRGGQGAPLVPVFHQALFSSYLDFLDLPAVWLNVGGVANITFIDKDKNQDTNMLAFDVGPGNGLIDDWVKLKTNTDYEFDINGQFAASGIIDETLLNQWTTHTYFKQPPPKSLDRLTFKTFLESCINNKLSLENGAATLTAFTIAAFNMALKHLPKKPKIIIISGGGAHNNTLCNFLHVSSKIKLLKAQDLELANDAIEAYAFGYLAVRSFLKLPLSYPSTTNVPSPTLGGTISGL